MNNRTCVHCGDVFNLDSQLKRRVGGKINECPDCVVELQTEIKETIRAVSSGDGKMACITMAGVTFTCVVLVISTLVDGGDMDGGEVNVAVHIG